MEELLAAFDQLHFSRPNPTRLRNNAQKSKRFVRSGTPNCLRLHAATLKDLNDKYRSLTAESEDIVAIGHLIPRSVYSSAPSFLVRLIDQINASYENRIYDGCAVLMRRLLEILLIRTYEAAGLQSRIRNADGSFKMLEGIASDAKSGNHLSLSRNTKERLDDFRTLGNFAAHKIEFSTRKGDIDKLGLDFRASVEELLAKSRAIT